MATITPATIKTLRPIIQRAINEAIAKATRKGQPELAAELGRITYIPGVEFRCKLTVTEAVARAAQPELAVGQSWRFAGKTYRITDFGTAFVFGERRSRARAARNGYATYRIKRSDFDAQATLVND